jgi:hypothetical protein
MSMAIISLAEGMRKGAEDPFWALRGQAVQAYANLEQALCRIFSRLSGTPHDIAATIFFKITSTQSRDAILDKLMKMKLKNEYNIFWNSLQKQLPQIANKRNHIIHWNGLNTISSNEAGETVVRVTLRPPRIGVFDINSATPVIEAKDLIAFSEKFDFFSRLCNMFVFIVLRSHHHTIGEADRKPWLDIFRQPIIYPAPDGHLLARKPEPPQTPPRSSPAYTKPFQTTRRYLPAASARISKTSVKASWTNSSRSRLKTMAEPCPEHSKDERPRYFTQFFWAQGSLHLSKAASAAFSAGSALERE